MSDDPRIPKKHGVPVAEVVDLGGPVARISRTTYVGSKWTRLTVMVPDDHAHGIRGGSVDISLTDDRLAHLLERLAWPK